MSGKKITHPYHVKIDSCVSEKTLSMLSEVPTYTLTLSERRAELRINWLTRVGIRYRGPSGQQVMVDKRSLCGVFIAYTPSKWPKLASGITSTL
jgi:hypothetical protein